MGNLIVQGSGVHPFLDFSDGAVIKFAGAAFGHLGGVAVPYDRADQLSTCDGSFDTSKVLKYDAPTCAGCIMTVVIGATRVI